MQETAVSILEELAHNTAKGQLYTMFTEFTRNDRRPLSSVVEAIDFLLDNQMVNPRFAYPGMERISITLNDKGRKLLSDTRAEHKPAASDLIA
jgi:hypothetical protein